MDCSHLHIVLLSPLDMKVEILVPIVMFMAHRRGKDGCLLFIYRHSIVQHAVCCPDQGF